MNEDANRGRPAIRVLIADDHAMFRQGVVEMLRTAEEIEVVGEAENGERAVAMVRRLVPDVVLLDVDIPLMGAEKVMRRMGELLSAVRIAAQSPVGPDDDAIMVVPPEVFSDRQAPPGQHYGLERSGQTHRTLEIASG